MLLSDWVFHTSCLLCACNHEFFNHYLCNHRALVCRHSCKHKLLLQSWTLERWFRQESVEASRMRQATKAPVNGQLLNCNLLYCIGQCWKTKSLHGSTTDLQKCSRPSIACVFLPERYYLTVVKGNALKPILQKPISLASSVTCCWYYHRYLCFKSFFNSAFYAAASGFQRWEKSWLPGYMDEEVQHVILGAFISCLLECRCFMKQRFILSSMVHSLSEEKGLT